MKIQREAMGYLIELGGPSPWSHTYIWVYFSLPMTRSKSQVIHVHWFAYMVNKQLLELHQGLEGSHLFHKAWCTETKHLYMSWKSQYRPGMLDVLSASNVHKNHIASCIIFHVLIKPSLINYLVNIMAQIPLRRQISS
jgi:hypothetical protein